MGVQGVIAVACRKASSILGSVSPGSSSRHVLVHSGDACNTHDSWLPRWGLLLLRAIHNSAIRSVRIAFRDCLVHQQRELQLIRQ